MFLTSSLLVSSATKSATAVIVKMLLEKAPQYFKDIQENIDMFVFNALDQYQKNYTKRHGLIKIIEMQNPINLDDVYTSINLLDTGDQIKDEITVVNNNQYLMVLGRPGTGKSTLLKKIGLEALKFSSQTNCDRSIGDKLGFAHCSLPVFIQLRDFKPNETKLEQLISEEFNICKFPAAQRFTETALQEGKLLILLDGLDEISAKDRNAAIQSIQDFVDKYNENRFIITSRLASYKGGLTSFNDVFIVDFDEQQIKNFIGKWFQANSSKEMNPASQFYEELTSPENKNAFQIAQKPLFLTLLCQFYKQKQSFPKNRSILYRKILKLLLEKWAEQQVIYAGFDADLEEELLSTIACRGFEANQIEFTKRKLIEQIADFLKQNGLTSLDSKAILKAIVEQQGILVQPDNDNDNFVFFHLTLQEYLTALYIYNHDLIENLVSSYLTNVRWKEVFLLLAGIMNKQADQLLLQIEKEAQSYINTPKLRAFLSWADRATSGSESEMKPAAKRAIALCLYLSVAVSRSLDMDCSLEPARHRARALVDGIACTIDPSTIRNFAQNTGRKSFNVIAEVAAINPELIPLLNPQHEIDFPADQKLNFNCDKDLYKLVGLALAIAHDLQEKAIFKEVDFHSLISRLKGFREKLVNHQILPEARQDFAHEVLQTWCHSFSLDPELIKLSEAETKALGDYFYANLLMLRCKVAAVQLSPDVWQAIEQRILLIPSEN